MIPLLTVTISQEEDVVLSRQRARRIAELFGLDRQGQTQFATAVSELARNVYEYAKHGHAEFMLDDCAAPPQLVARLKDNGPGIQQLDAVMDGSYVSPTGMGIGIMGARRLSDAFRIESEPGRGTVIEIGKILNRRSNLTPADVRTVVDMLARERAESTVGEFQRQNHELIFALDEARQRRDEVERLNDELSETNRGVLALYAELEDRATEIKQVAEIKSKFFSEVSHELRTPLASILSLSWLLLNKSDGPLLEEQEHQVTLIRNAAQTLRELVDDLLDLAKIEAGVFTPKISDFSVEDLFGSLRGMFRPLLGDSSISLTFEIQPGVPVMVSDEARVAQVLRNFISNAIKFTPEGSIHVKASTCGVDTLCFEVKDSGIGIAPDDQERIFLDFVQVDNPIQRRVRGTGLGLPLSRKLATLLGGHIELYSTPDAGSTFTLIVPRVLPLTETLP